MPSAWGILRFGHPPAKASTPAPPRTQPAPSADQRIYCVIDEPDVFVIAGRSINIRGWATAPAGIASVTAQIDGTLVGTTRCDVPRPDIAPGFPQSIGANLAGYRFPGRVVPASVAGMIELLVIATSHDGRVQTARRSLRVLRNVAETIATLRALDPAASSQYVLAARAFVDSGQFPAAEALAAVASARFPDDAAGISEFARIETQAVRSGAGDAREACRRWTTARQRFPNEPALWIAEGEALVLARRFDDADAALAAAVQRFPDDLSVWQAYCTAALGRAEASRQPDGSSWWPLAEERWRELHRRAHHAGTAAILGYILLRMNRYADADAVLTAAIRRWPDHAALARFHAMSASDRQNWPEAKRRWAAARARFPDDPTIARDADAALARADSDLADSAPAVALQPIPATPNDGIDDRDLLLHFESLGSNDDLGLIQRQAGAEPPGLLRFARTQPDSLLPALAARFAGVGEAENTTLGADDAARPEYWTDDLRFGFRVRTFILADDGAERNEGQIFAQQCQRMRHLAAQLVADLAASEKIFVYHTDDRLTPERIEELFAAVSLYGPNALLYVTLADAGHPPGSIELLRPRLMVGRIAGSTDRVPDYPSWRQLCLATYRHWLAWHGTAAAAQ